MKYKKIMHKLLNFFINTDEPRATIDTSPLYISSMPLPGIKNASDFCSEEDTYRHP